MSPAIVAAILVGHGLITSMIGFVAVTSPNAPAMALPSWFAWWPGPFGRSWLFEALSFGTAASVIGGFIWLVGGLLITAFGTENGWRFVFFVNLPVGLVTILLSFRYLPATAKAERGRKHDFGRRRQRFVDIEGLEFVADGGDDVEAETHDEGIADQRVEDGDAKRGRHPVAILVGQPGGHGLLPLGKRRAN